MERIIEIAVRGLNAVQTNDMEYVCDNTDYIAEFDFDEEWDGVDPKTARFVYGGEHQDIVFTGNRCEIPRISDVNSMRVGVFAGNLVTTTPAQVICRRSILGKSGLPADPAPDVYAQIMEVAFPAAVAAAEESAKQAAASEQNAKTSETNAEQSAKNAAESAENLSTAEKNAKESAEQAKTSETNAKTSEGNAKTSENNAKASETAASGSASDAAVAKENAEKAKTDAEAAATRAEAARQGIEQFTSGAEKSATDAKAAAKKAEQHEANAKQSETNVKASEQNAKASESNAKTSMEAAAESANDAAKSAKEAKDAAESIVSSESISPTATVAQTDSGAIVTITDKNGTTTATLTNGKDGANGVSPTIDVSKSGKVTTLTIKDVNGTQTATIKDGEDGSGGSGGGSGADLLTENSIIKREHLPDGFPYEEGKIETILSETTPAYSDGTFMITDPFLHPLVEGHEYTVVLNGTSYTTLCQLEPLEGVLMLGDASLIGSIAGNGEPFFIMMLPSESVADYGAYGFLVDFTGATSVTLSISGFVGTITKIAAKYLPERESDVLIVTCEKTGSTYHSLSHTCEEIREAIKAWKQVLLYVDDTYGSYDIYTPISLAANGVHFSRVTAQDSGTLVAQRIHVLNEGTLRYNAVYLSKADV